MWIMAGTAKGLFRFHSPDRVQWRALSPVLTGSAVYASAFDRERGQVLAAVNNEFYGPGIRRSPDWGETWDQGGAGPAYAPDDPERVSRVWALRPVGGGRIYAGVEASGLFRSDDAGDTWTEVTSLRAHPTHDTWGPGFGGKCLHTIVPDPFDGDRLYVACSTGGCYRTDDGGLSWRPVNRGIRADFLPDDQRYPESGQCVHKVAATPAQAGRLWLQNHGGVYRSDDGGEHWHSVGEGLPDDFGFGIVSHPLNGDVAYVIPLVSSGAMPRWPVDNRLRVFETNDGGETWASRGEGLPNRVFSGVLRDAFTADARDPLGLYIGTTSGELYASHDEGRHWSEVARHLPRILSVTVVDNDD